jgi:8-oxo-dGTP pyrophosphatase MutT (NUDIX family)
MNWDHLLADLQQALNQPLPGPMAQLKMAPKPVDMERFKAMDTSAYRYGSVLILLHPKEGKLLFPLIQRPIYPGVHSGQVSLPGGKLDQTDEDIVSTALRETREEIGVEVAKKHVIGSLSEMFIPPSKFRVTPVVAFKEEVHQMVPDQREVMELFTVSIDDILNDTVRKETKLNIKGAELQTPYFELHGKVVWGATAMILSEFSDILKKIV